jgi:uncharacterized membrane protein
MMAALYVAAGINHFVKPKMYLSIMPNYLPNHKLLVPFSGLLEIILGILVCVPIFKNAALILIILMLFVFLTVHFYMISNKKASAGLPKWLLILRIPMQLGLIYWAYSGSR